jgi:hypothetical protein
MCGRSRARHILVYILPLPISSKRDILAHPTRKAGCFQYRSQQGVGVISLLRIQQIPLATLWALSSTHLPGCQLSILHRNPGDHPHMKRLQGIYLHLNKFYSCPTKNLLFNVSKLIFIYNSLAIQGGWYMQEVKSIQLVGKLYSETGWRKLSKESLTS